jgi:hypothetical protein
MSNAALSHALFNQVPRILEEAAYVLIESVNAPLPESYLAVVAQLDFSGPRSGVMWLATSAMETQHLAEEMLGEDSLDDSIMGEKALAEVLNILTPWVLDAWWGANADYRVGTPLTLFLNLCDTIVWSLPDDQRVVLSTVTGATLLCGASLDG